MASRTAMVMDPAISFFERRSGSWGLPFPDAAALQKAPSLLTITNYLRNRVLPLLLGALWCSSAARQSRTFRRTRQSPTKYLDQ